MKTNNGDFNDGRHILSYLSPGYICLVCVCVKHGMGFRPPLWNSIFSDSIRGANEVGPS